MTKFFHKPPKCVQNKEAQTTIDRYKMENANKYLVYSGNQLGENQFPLDRSTWPSISSLVQLNWDLIFASPKKLTLPSIALVNFSMSTQTLIFPHSELSV